jgi:hypothetical protein
MGMMMQLWYRGDAGDYAAMTAFPGVGVCGEVVLRSARVRDLLVDVARRGPQTGGRSRFRGSGECSHAAVTLPSA